MAYRLVSWDDIQPAEIKPLVLNVFEPSWGFGRKSLKEEVEVVKARFCDLQSQNDQETIETWTQAQKKDIRTRFEIGHMVYRSMKEVDEARDKELKRMWRERAIEKILEMGYTPFKEEDLPVDKRGKWKSLTERGVSWSETVALEWNRQMHQVVQFIKNDEKERPERQRKERRAARDAKLRELLDSFQLTMNVLPSNRSELSMTEIANAMAGWLPLPRLSDMVELPIIQSLLETDVPTTEMVVQFEQSRDVIATQILEFGAQVKKEWAKIVRDGRAQDEPAIPLSTPCLLAIGSELNPFDKLDEDTCLLFRADTLLDFEPDQHTRSKTQSYDSLVGLVLPGQPIHTPQNKSKFAAKDYNWDSKASSMARMLLSSMGHPINTASIEFSAANGRWFACGRCTGPRMSWAGLVSHYCKEAGIWEDAQEHISELPDGIFYRNIHAMEFDARPLVKCLSAAEAEELETRYPGGEEAIWDEELARERKFYDDDYRLGCRLCMGANIGSPMSFHPEDIYPHVVHVHGVSDPENNVDDELSIEENPYVCVLEIMPGWGWCSVA
ncbi:hypothetical protein RhiLY_01222 [Ceratobasidium sp. AG-Ba]|nr:hypothetical protein RhiLY_01222 [Ceratobasidium sp. AG-Ba]